MIRAAVTDYSAESRSRIIERLESFLSEAGNEIFLLPRLNFKPVSPQELRFNSAPDVCIIGPEVIDRDLTEISKVKKLFPNSAVIAWLSDKQSRLSVVEQLARQGADDVLTSDASPQDFFRRLLILSRKAAHKNSGKLLLVDGGKGGVGVTTLAASLGELASACGKNVALIDLDFETQDLSRFLQARPFLNENLRLLLDEERPVTEETVAQCLNKVWEDDFSLHCMSPVGEADDLHDPRSRLPKMFLSVLEILDSCHDLVIVDMGCARSLLRSMFYRVADKLLFVINEDPASLYASVDKLSRIRSSLSAGAQLGVVENFAGFGGLSNKLLRREFSRVARLEAEHWAPDPVSYCRTGQRWPGSGASFLSQAKAHSARQIENLGVWLSILEPQESRPSLKDLLFGFVRKDSARPNSAKLPGCYSDKSTEQANKPLLLISQKHSENKLSEDSDQKRFNQINNFESSAIQEIKQENEFNIDTLVSAPRYKIYADKASHGV